MKPQPSRHALTSYLLGALLCATFACKPELQSGVYECKENEKDACPAGWLCERRGGLGFRCYESEGGFCGDGAVDPGEQCDGEALGDPLVCGASSFPFCLTDCRVACTTCGNGKREVPTPDRGEECDDGNLVDGDGCSAQCTLPFCGDGLVDASLFEGCDLGEYNSDEPGADCRTNCQPRRCGDGVVDVVHDEVCDDGNLDPTDNCTPDCKSDGRCGNGYVDFLKGELCDDGNFLSHDGCSSDCLSESPSWSQEPANATAPGARQHQGFAYDSARGRAVLFGGLDSCWADPSETLGDTWEWDGAHWHQMSTFDGPPPRRSHAMAYDPVSRSVVLFGGVHSGMVDGSTWEWNGSTWRLVATAAESPPARSGHSMAYDPIRRRVLLFGGYPTSDMWEWDGKNKKWHSVTSQPTPSARTNAGMVFHPKLGVMLLYGGNETSTFLPLSDMWMWSPNTMSWLSVDTQAPGPAGNASSLAFDTTRGVLVLARSHHIIWEWRDPSEGWVQKQATWDEPFSVHRASYFPPVQKTLVFGANCENSTTYWSGSQWSAVPTHSGAAPATSGHLLHDPLSRELYLVVAAANTSIEFWSRMGLSWLQLLNQQSLVTTGDTAAAHDSRRGRIVLHDGTTGGTWEWSKPNWRPVATAPVPLASPRAIYDSKNSRSLLIGNVDYARETWQWTGSTWSQVNPFDSGYRGEALSYDLLRDRAVWFGGYVPGGRISSMTHELEAELWTAKSPSRSPPASAEAIATFDQQLGRTLVQTGPSTWIWDGTDWSVKRH